MFAENRRNCYNVTGESPETLLEFVRSLDIEQNFNRHKLSVRNRVLLFVV